MKQTIFEKIIIIIKMTENGTKLIGKYLVPIIPSVCLGIFVVTALMGYLPSKPGEYQVLASESGTQQEMTSQTESTTEEPALQGKIELEDGVYRGTGIGYGGNVTVDVTVLDKTMTDITVVSADSETESFFNQAKKVIDTMLSTQSADVDVISGATYSSRGIISAVRNALYGEEPEGTTAAGANTGKAPSVTKIKEDGEYKDGTYTGSAQGFGGPIKVKVTIKDGKINKIEVTEASGEGSSYMNKARGLIKTMVKKNTTNVDAVSGATYSSNGLIKAVRNALSKAKVTKKKISTKKKKTKKTQESTTENNNSTGETISSGELEDGTYTGSGSGFRGPISVALTIKDGKVTSIEITGKSDDEPFFTNAKNGIVNNVLNQQSTAVDTVSGATFSSKGLLEAINNALNKARKTSSATNTESATESTREETPPESTTEDSQESIQEVTYQDGIYPVTSYCSQYRYYVSMNVTIANNKIISVDNISHTSSSKDDASFMEKAVEGIVPQIIDKGNASGIDAVSGATYSSKAIIDGCKLALSQAKSK